MFFLLLAALAAVCLVRPRSVRAASPGSAAIVLASFGSTVPEARDVETDFVRAVRQRYPDARIILANTAKKVMRKNAGQGVHIPSLFRVLADLADEGCPLVAVQSLHLIPGSEFDGVLALARSHQGLPKGIGRLAVGLPLLACNEDCEATARALAASLPSEREAGQPVIFVGHGTHHGLAGMVYPALAWHLARLDPDFLVAALEDRPSLEDILDQLAATGSKTVWLAPLLALAGDHAVNDIYGPDPDSWFSRLTAAGYLVRHAPTPLLAMAGIREIVFGHLNTALEDLSPLERAIPVVRPGLAHCPHRDLPSP